MIAIKAFYEAEGKFISFDPEENGNDITMKIKTLREEMYKMSPNKGAWYMAMFTVMNNGHLILLSIMTINLNSNMSRERQILDDLNIFPRQEELIPEWLKEIVKS